MRFFADISYLGTAYHGWQVQKNAVTVQQKINEALSIILGYEIKCMGSGRTDAGVHAIQQIAHFDVLESVDLLQVQHKLNGLLPSDISVNSIYQVKDEANARFDADSRSYIYRIHKKKDPFLTKRSYCFSRELHLNRMNVACNFLLKNCTNFQAFSRVKTDVNNFECKIYEIGFKEDDDHIIFFIKANRFLRGMVRAIVGTLIDVGEYKIGLNDFKRIVESKDRKKAGRAVPAHGLYLNEIVYPEEILIK